METIIKDTTLTRPKPAFALRRRLIAGTVGAACLAVLLVAASLRADEAGHGTHTQLGLPPCQFLMKMDMPCYTCGMTTAFSLAADGHLLAAFLTQPFGAMLALTLAMVLIVCVYIAATGADLGRWRGAVGWWPMAWAVVGLFVAAWVFKIATYKGWFG